MHNNFLLVRFRHFRQAGSSRSRDKLKPVYTVHVICLDGPQYTEVDPGIIRKMNEKNLGSRTLRIKRKSSRSSLMSKIGKEYNLTCNFKLMRAVKDDGRFSLKILEGTTTASIKAECHRSKIYVLPDEQIYNSSDTSDEDHIADGSNINNPEQNVVLPNLHRSQRQQRPSHMRTLAVIANATADLMEQSSDEELPDPRLHDPSLNIGRQTGERSPRISQDGAHANTATDRSQRRQRERNVEEITRVGRQRGRRRSRARGGGTHNITTTERRQRERNAEESTRDPEVQIRSTTEEANTGPSFQTATERRQRERNAEESTRDPEVQIRSTTEEANTGPSFQNSPDTTRGRRTRRLSLRGRRPETIDVTERLNPSSTPGSATSDPEVQIRSTTEEANTGPSFQMIEDDEAGQDILNETQMIEDDEAGQDNLNETVDPEVQIRSTTEDANTGPSFQMIEDDEAGQDILNETQIISSVGNQLLEDLDLQTVISTIKNTYQEIPEKELKIRRNNIIKDVLHYYQDSTILNFKIKVVFEGEIGEDLGGLTRDMFSSFWKKACQEFFRGEDSVVPSLPIHRRREAADIFAAIGRVLCHMIGLCGILPPNLCRSLLLSTISDSEIIDQELLLQDFLLHVSFPERTLVKRLLSSSHWSERDKDMISSMFQTYGMHSYPSVENLKNQILDMANSELLDKPNHLCKFLKKGFSDFFVENFFFKLNSMSITNFFASLLPSREKVLDCLKTDENLRADEEVIFYYLQNFIREITFEVLEQFICFVTGSPLMPTEGIKVTFSNSFGLNRCPRAHTCGNLIDLPVGYVSYQEFRRELTSIVTSDEAFTMNAI
ncbi:unnamed protein product [Mytilus coruscus]|uniref:HECT-type E3 ubiquitin transferase n=1 Tax=Mytilus coruscus TaxID=42192 RepID=A0A6J8D7S0_MYTCO|nr:unnamed protein product [Mytilus coruscus]